MRVSADHPGLARAIQTLSHEPERSLRVCRGLSYTETACFAGLLLQPNPLAAARLLTGPDGALLQRALSQHGHTTNNTMGHTILARLNLARHLSTSLLHPEWGDWLRSTERPVVASVVLEHGERTLSDATRWLLGKVATRSGMFDPRHLHEWALGEVLEPDALRLIPTSDALALIQHLGLAITGSICKAADRRYLNAMVRKLGVTYGGRMVEALQGPRIPEGSSRLAVTRFGSRRALSGSNKDLLARIERTGLFILSCALAFRDRVTFDGVAHALPHRLGETMLTNHSNIVTDRLAHQIHEPLLAWALESLKHLAERGRTHEPYHTRRVVLQPPGGT